MKKLFCLFLAIFMLISCCLVGCESEKDDREESSSTENSSTENSKTENSKTESSETESSEDESSSSKEEESDDDFSNEDKESGGFLNEPKYWRGEVVNILAYNGQYSYHTVQIDTNKYNGNPINDAVYERNEFIYENFGIDIEVIIPEGDEEPIAMLREDMISCLNTYQAAAVPIVYIAPLAVERLLYNFASAGNDYIHLDQAWWDQTLIEDLAIDDSVYFLAGDALIEDDEATWAIYFNKDLLKDYNIEEDPYQLVRDGKWTLDKMYELAQKVERTNGNKKHYDTSLVVGGDQWGIVAQSYDFYQFMLGCEQTIVDNSGRFPNLRILEEENVSTFNTITNFFYDPVNCGVADYMGAWNSGVYDKEIMIFSMGNALFMPGPIANVGLPAIREAEINYGILPMPKRNTLQKDYSSSVSVYHYPVISIPYCSNKVDVTCYALEAMAYYGRQIVTPEYHDHLLTLRRYEDENSAEMFDHIFSNRTYDLGAVYDFSSVGNGTLYFYTNLVGAKSTDIVFAYEKNKNAYMSAIEEFVAISYSG